MARSKKQEITKSAGEFSPQCVENPIRPLDAGEFAPQRGENLAYPTEAFPREAR